MLYSGIIHQVDRDSATPHIFTKRGYFRLQLLKSPRVLNLFRIWTKKTGLDQLSPDPKPALTLSLLFRQMTKIINSTATNVDIVNNNAVRKDPRFKGFEVTVCQLQLINLKDMDESAKKSFFINIYNLMTKHASIKLCPKKEKRGVLDSIKYNVGGVIFGLEDIYHGILRRNSKHPKILKRMFAESDPRACFSLQEEDTRIHFALNNSNNRTLYEYN